MFYTYVLATLAQPVETYVGATRTFPDKRVSEHNAGLTPSTASKRPWQLLAYFAFPTEAQSFAFEQYLKTGSGRAFLNKWMFEGKPRNK